jgi:hypothetical protein
VEVTGKQVQYGVLSKNLEILIFSTTLVLNNQQLCYSSRDYN